MPPKRKKCPNGQKKTCVKYECKPKAKKEEKKSPAKSPPKKSPPKKKAKKQSFDEYLNAHMDEFLEEQDGHAEGGATDTQAYNRAKKYMRTKYKKKKSNVKK